VLRGQLLPKQYGVLREHLRLALLAGLLA